MTSKTTLAPVAPDTLPQGLLDDLSRMIEQTRRTMASTVNAGLTLLYWRVGIRVRSEVLNYERAEHGKAIVVTLSRQLARTYGNGFTDKNLRRMLQFAEIFPDEKVVVSLIRQLSWSHFTTLLPLKDPLKRDFYAEMCRIEQWNVRTLRKKIVNVHLPPSSAGEKLK